MDFDVVIVGGGVQGVGVLHDLASRRITGAHLLEERCLSIGTSSRSTKLLHGGLRYLEHFNQWGLVREALRERGILLRLLRDVARPVPIVLPAFKGARPAWMIQLGLGLYDAFAGDSGLPSARRLKLNELQEIAPYLNEAQIRKNIDAAFLYYDGQMLDDVVVKVAARASCRLGASYSENAHVSQIEPLAERRGFRIRGTRKEPQTQLESSFEITARRLVVTTGAWNNSNLLRWGFTPPVPCILNVGSHIVFQPEAVQADSSRAAAALIQHRDGRVLFFLPWFGKWLYGTTESSFKGDPRSLKTPASDVEYLLEAAEGQIELINPRQNMAECFSGVRTMPINPKGSISWRARKGGRPEMLKSHRDHPFESPYYLEATPQNLSRLSRETVVAETAAGMWVVYGGKYTTYRSQAERIGRIIKESLGKGSLSLTASPESWFLEAIRAEEPELFVSSQELRSA